MNFKSLKYLSPATIYVLAFVAFHFEGWLTWAPMIYAWILIPLTELVLKPDEKNMDAAEEALAGKDKIYDYVLYLFVILLLIF